MSEKLTETRVDRSSSHSPLCRCARDRSEPGSGPQQEMLENLSKHLNLSGEQKNQLKAIPGRDMD